MRYFNLILIGLFCYCSSYGQFVNNGATVVIEAGATLFVDEDIQNNAGTIENNGTIEVTGNLTNAATITSDPASKVIFSGTANAVLTSGGAVLENIEMNKTTADLILADAAAYNGDFSFVTDDNKVMLGAFDMTIGAAGTITGADANDYFVTDGSGYLVKNYSAAGSFDYPVGSDDADYAPLTSNFTGTTGAGAAIKVNANDVAASALPSEATDYINRFWDVEANGITSYSNTVTGTYVAGDIAGTASLIKGASHDGTDWSFAGAANGANTVTGIIEENDVEFTGMNFFGQVDLVAFIEGCYSGGALTTNLTGLIPLTSPYTDAPLTVTSIPAGVTDWIKIEVRDATNPATVKSKHSAFIKSNGQIVGEDGTSLPLLKDADPNAYIALYHRNHLPIRTSSTLDLVNTTPYDFSTGLAQAYDNTGLATDAMKDLGGGVYGLWKANVNSDTNINIVDFILTKNNSSPTQVGVYSYFDVNMDGNLNIIDFILAKASTTPTKVAHL